ncbi:uncharacterized protein LOC102709890 [Oryza brachyantha]|uniref:uncharacterized protein LOC102709890 n=1 Tax=Oryza brachyantha TaxID=4533 RepID=UPI000776451C|nr:uncharacterized protein LOC102709890 [Oryza brachyantha]
MPIFPTEAAPSQRRRDKGPSQSVPLFRPFKFADSSHLKPSPAMRVLPLNADSSHRKPSPAIRMFPREMEAEIPGHGRSKRPTSTLSFDADSTREGSCQYPAWVILNRLGGRRDSLHGDGTTSAVSYTSGGEKVSVSFELAEPPRTSLVTLDWPRGPDPSEGSTSYPEVVAAHGSLVLLQIISTDKGIIDYFVYDARASEKPSLTRLPICYWQGTSNRGKLRPRIMSNEAMGILSCSKDFFIVAELEKPNQPFAANIYFLCSGSDDWRVFKDVPIPHEHDHSFPGLLLWSTDAMLSYRHRYLIWVDYFSGMIVAKFAHPGDIDILNPQEPVLSYVPLPVEPFQGQPYEVDRGEVCPEASRSLCYTHDGIKFIDVNLHGSGSGFSITLWSWCGDQTWRQEATLDAAQLWNLDSENRLPNGQPEFPVVDMDNPYIICFLLTEGHHIVSDPDATTYMIKVHMKKKILVDFTTYSNKGSPSYHKSYMTSRMMSEGLSFISSEMPYYLSRQTKKRRS